MRARDDLFWDDGAGLVREEPETKRVYDLEERTARFGEAIIDFAKDDSTKSGNYSNYQSDSLGPALALALTTSKPTTQFPKRNF